MTTTTRSASTRTVFPYARVSTLGQADGVSPEAQIAAAEEWAADRGHRVGSSEFDALSGRRANNRPGLQKVLDAVCAAKGILVVYSLLRLARSVPDTYAIVQRLQKSGADLVSLTENIDTTTAMGRAFFGFMAVIAQLECDLIGERTRFALAHLKERGKRYGEVPFGKRVVGDALVNDEAEAKIRAAMRELRLDGLSWPLVAEELNRQGVPTKKGRRWTGQNARKIGLAIAL